MGRAAAQAETDVMRSARALSRVDVTVRGAGIFGLAIAWACASRGARVRLIDPDGAGAGASGGVVGALAPHVPERWNAKKAFQLDSLLAAPAFWQAVEAAGGISAGYARTGRLQPVADEAALIRAREREAAARVLWRGAAAWEVVRADDLGAWAPATPTGWLIHDTLSARLNPARACDALVAALGTLGVAVVPQGDDAGAVVWATGVAGLAALGADLGRAVGGGVKGQAALLDHDARAAPQLFADALHIVPHADGTTAVGSTSERDWTHPGTDAALEDVVARAVAAVPALAGSRVVRRWAGVRPRARSRAPMLGPWPGRPGHWIANGGFKIGLGLAPAVAAAMTDAVLDGRDVPDIFRVEASL